MSRHIAVTAPEHAAMTDETSSHQHALTETIHEAVILPIIQMGCYTVLLCFSANTFFALNETNKHILFTNIYQCW